MVGQDVPGYGEPIRLVYGAGGHVFARLALADTNPVFLAPTRGDWLPGTDQTIGLYKDPSYSAKWQKSARVKFVPDTKTSHDTLQASQTKGVMTIDVGGDTDWGLAGHSIAAADFSPVIQPVILTFDSGSGTVSYGDYFTVQVSMGGGDYAYLQVGSDGYVTARTSGTGSKFTFLPPESGLADGVQDAIDACDAQCETRMPKYVDAGAADCKDACRLRFYSGVDGVAASFQKQTQKCFTYVKRYQLSTGEFVRWWSLPAGNFYEGPDENGDPSGELVYLELPNPTSSGQRSNDYMTEFETHQGAQVGVYWTGGVYEVVDGAVQRAQKVSGQESADTFFGPYWMRDRSVPTNYFMYYRGSQLMPYFTTACWQQSDRADPGDPFAEPNVKSTMRLVNNASMPLMVSDPAASDVALGTVAAGGSLSISTQGPKVTIGGTTFAYTPTLNGAQAVSVNVVGGMMQFVDVDGYATSVAYQVPRASMFVEVSDGPRPESSEWVGLLIAAAAAAAVGVLVVFIALAAWRE